MVGLLDDAWTGWQNYWEPKEVPKGALYDPETLGQARAASIGQLGGTMLALAQGGLSPETRAKLLAGIGSTPLTYQQSLLAGVHGRLQGAQIKKLEQETAAEEAWRRFLSGDMGAAAPPSAPTGAPVAAGAPTAPTAAPGVPDIQTAARRALLALKIPESGGEPGIQNSGGYGGLYQIGTSLANSAGIYQPAQGEAVAGDKGRAVNAWKGTWRIPGFDPMTHAEFLANPRAQDAAGEAAMQHNWKNIQAQGLDRYVGQTVGGVTITPEALLQGAWLGGVGGLNTWLSGQGDPKDKNNTPVSRWAGLSVPGTAVDAGAPAMVPSGRPPAYGPQGQTQAPAPAPGTPTAAPGPQRNTRDTLTRDQRALMMGLTHQQAAAAMNEHLSSYRTTMLTDADKQAMGLRGVYWWDKTGKPTQVAPPEAEEMTLEEKKRNNIPPDAAAYWNEKRVPVIVTPGTDVNAPMNQSDAYATLQRHAAAVKAGKLDENSPEGMRYKAAYALLEGGERTPVEMPDGTTKQVWQTKPVPYPRLGAVSAGPEGLTIKGAPPMSETEAHATLARHQAAVEAGTLEENSPEGRRYKAAYDLLAKGKWIDAVQKDKTKARVWEEQPMSYPRLGKPPAVPTGATTAVAPDPSQFFVQTKVHLASMQAADKIIQDLKGKGYTEGNTHDMMVNRAPDLAARWLRTEEGQQYEQAQIDWTLAKLRWESGAGITREEAAEQFRNYFPQPFDGPKVIAQKAARRTGFTNALKQIVGDTGDGDGGSAPAPAPAAATPIPEGQTQGSIVRSVRERIASGKATRAQAETVLRGFGIDPSHLD